MTLGDRRAEELHLLMCGVDSWHFARSLLRGSDNRGHGSVPKRCHFVLWETFPEWRTFLSRVKDIEFCLEGPCKWAGILAQMERTVKTVQGGCWAMMNAITERKTKARGPRRPQGKAKSTKTYDVEEWMQGMEAASDVELWWNEGEECGCEWQSVHSQHGGRNRRSHRQ